jgi:hypothetical protein
MVRESLLAKSESCLNNLNRSDGKDAKQVMKQTANDIDLVKRSSSPCISLLKPTVSCR